MWNQLKGGQLFDVWRIRNLKICRSIWNGLQKTPSLTVSLKKVKYNEFRLKYKYSVSINFYFFEAPIINDKAANEASYEVVGKSKLIEKSHADDEEEPEDDTTLFIKNLNFETTEGSIKEVTFSVTS